MNNSGARQKIQAAIKIHTGHMKSTKVPSKESETKEMKLLKGALKDLNPKKPT